MNQNPKIGKMKGAHCICRGKKKEKLTVGGPCADTNKDFPKDYREPGNQTGNRSTYFTRLQ